ncbi:MAG: hypothetical protein ACRC2T_16610 [Thermoguttaceae bacterium]
MSNDEFIPIQVYLDTTIFGFLVQPESPDKMAVTKAFWEIINRDSLYNSVISTVTVQELSASPKFLHAHFSKFLDELAPIIIEENDATLALFENYNQLGVLGGKNVNDLRHIACAAYYECNMIVSWNFRHFVNENTILRLRKANKKLGREFIEILSPATFIERYNNDENDRLG